MKNKIRIIIFLIIAVVMMLAACDALIAPMKERANPYDASNPVPAAADFSAGINIDQDGIRIVLLTWSEGLTEVQGNLEGYVIVRSFDSPPQSIWAGELVVLIQNQDFLYEDRVGDNPDYFFGNTIYYSIFSYGPKWQDMNEEDKIGTDENNILLNTQNYNFTGPVTASQDVWDVVDLPVALDKWIASENPAWQEGDAFLNVADITTPMPLHAFSAVKFDFTNRPDGDIKYAQLMLTKYDFNANGEGAITLSVWDNDWEIAADYTSANDYTTSYAQEVTVPESNNSLVEINVTHIYNDWNDGILANYGFKIAPSSSDNSFPFCASEEGSNGPKLRVYYMH